MNTFAPFTQRPWSVVKIPRTERHAYRDYRRQWAMMLDLPPITGRGPIMSMPMAA